MKQQYDRVDDDRDPLSEQSLERATENKGDSVFRLLQFPSISTLHTEDYDTSRGRAASSASYASLIEHDRHAPQHYRFCGLTIPTGWRFGVYGCMMSCVLSFWINLILTIAVVAKYGVDSSGRLRLYSGDCDEANQLNTGLHVFINAMSTILLSSSNYVQQVLCAVTREEVDAAHEGKRRSRWADIGVPSVFNICLMDRRRVLLWWLLMFSSLPLHLFYNSAIFSSTTTFAFPIVTVNDAWLQAAKADPSPTANAINALDYAEHNSTQYFGTYNQTSVGYPDRPDYYTRDIMVTNGHMPRLMNGSDDYLRSLINSGAFTELTPADCQREYAKDFVVSRGGLLVVLSVDPSGTNDTNVTEPIVFDRAASWDGSSFCSPDRYAWICDQTGENICGSSLRAQNQSIPGWGYNSELKPCGQQISSLSKIQWKPTQIDYPVAKCLSQTMEQKCKVEASIHLMAVVLFLNLSKAVIMFMTIRWMRGVPLLTLGDAIASFLERPDPHSREACLLTRKEATHETIWLGKVSERPRAFNARRQRWHTASGKIRQIMVVVLLLVALSVIWYLYDLGKSFISDNGGTTDLKSQWSMGFGIVNPATTIQFTGLPNSGAAGLVWSAFIANVPQLVLSLIYFTYNSILTAYFLGVEWQSYFHSRKGLRVSDAPRGEQRTTYFLQLPYRAAIPLMIASGVLHWLVSQSIFLVSIQTYIWDSEQHWQNGTDPYVLATSNDFSGTEPNILTCGFSPIPMIFVMIIAGLMILSLLVLGSRKNNASMPVASSNSLAIAAACHLPLQEQERGLTSLRKVQWGVVEEDRNPFKDQKDIGHCCFSSGYVEEPKDKQFYA